MRRLKLWLPIVALAALSVAGAAIAIANQHTDPVTASLNGGRVAVREQTCTGDDGEYRMAAERWTGAMVGDARLSGDATLLLRSATNTTTGNGTFRGALVVRDATTNEIKVRSGLAGVLTNQVIMHGLIQGRTRDAGDLHGGLLMANFTGYISSPSLVIHLGDGNDNVAPAVVQRAGCRTARPRVRPRSRQGSRPRPPRRR